MRLGTHQECVGSSPRVSGACQDSAMEFAKRRPRLTGRLSGKAETLAGRLDDAEGAHREFARRFTKGIGKLARNTSGDHRRKIVRLTDGESEGFGLHPKKIDSECRYASRRRTQEWT
ncbi:hypothetical protein BHE74_00035053 [Ensete ventricosum]|nr:hypothetical protein BHE74_00035053 [Ensete ventricosum]RZS22913.1 hypothetical protein BHM03_00055744 [Ensete ventricosum]